MQSDPRIDGVAASQLVSGALGGALISALRGKGFIAFQLDLSPVG